MTRQKPEFEEIAVDFWVCPGKLGVSLPTLCLFQDSSKRGTLLLDALTELGKNPCPARYTLLFQEGTRESTLRTLTLLLVSAHADLKVMNIRHDNATATIEMTENGHSLITDAVNLWLTGAEDFGVSPRRSSLKSKDLGKLDQESGELWFWGPGYLGP